MSPVEELVERAELRTAMYRVEMSSGELTPARVSNLTGIGCKELMDLCKSGAIASRNRAGRLLVDRQSLLDYLESKEASHGK